MDVRATLQPGTNGTKALLKEYGDQLVCVRYRYDKKTHKRYKTAEIIIEEKDWTPGVISRPVKAVLLQVRFGETELRSLVKRSGGYWNPDKKAWCLPYRTAVHLGLENRIIDDELPFYFADLDLQIMSVYRLCSVVANLYSCSKSITAFGSTQYVCEQYGECNTLMCSELTPVEPLPTVPDPPAVIKNYSAQESSLLYRQIVILAGCSVLSQKNQQIRSVILESWSKDKPGLVDAFELTPEYPLDVEIMSNNILSSVPKQRQENISYCDNVLSQIKENKYDPIAPF